MTSCSGISRRGFLTAAGATGVASAALGLFGCGQSGSAGSGEVSGASGSSASSGAASSAAGSIALDNAKWNYDSDNDVYYQIGMQYCENPQAPTYESMGIYVPGAYFDARDNSFHADMGAGGGGAMGGGMMGGSDGNRGNGGPGGGQRGERPDGMPSGASSAESIPSGDATSGEASSGEAPSSGGAAAGPMGGTREGSGQASSESTTYETAADYIAALNGENAWITYDEAANTATISGLAGFVAACKSPSKSVGAFDALDRSQAENAVFGNESNEGLHFDDMMAFLLSNNSSAYAALSDWDDSYPKAYADDRAYTDAQGKSSDFRQQLYDPLYYLSDAYEGTGTSKPAAHWRIRTGIEQGDTALTTEINLALALGMSKQVADVDFATVWGQGHTMAERTGSSTDNFITWVNDCCK